MATLTCSTLSQAIYRPRRPEKTILFQVIKKHYKTWKNNANEPIPGYIDKVFKNYLACGILAKGFACAHCQSCHRDFLIAFSCKGRGLCPSCNTRAMVKVAAHLLENVIPNVPVRQWVISFPLRIRHYLQKPAILQKVLQIVIEEIRKIIIACCHDMPDAHIGAVSFIQNFGTTLNIHPHFHLVIADGVFSICDEQLLFHEALLTPDDVKDTQENIRNSVLKYFGKCGWFDKASIEKMLTYDNSGFSLDATVRIQPWDREGLERLIRYCARPPFASENLRWNGRSLVYRFPKPTHKGQTFLQLEPFDFLKRVAAFIPHPRRHRHHYHGAFAPNSPLRKKVAASAGCCMNQIVPPSVKKTMEKVSRVSFDWAKLIARIYEVNPLTCVCGGKIKIVAFVTHALEIQRILRGIGWPIESPDFDPPYDLMDWNFCQLIPGTQDGFPEMEIQLHWEPGPDPPSIEGCDPPHWEDHSDPPHWND